MSKLTEDEIKRLETVASHEEWNAMCLDIKKARDGGYSSDWYEKVIKPGGYLNQFQKRVGDEVGSGITFRTVRDG
ncbi:hypothetical protein LCGC14_1656770 [marine sediment metagenome]|uniref:Uncharacterized protein n=1 Tax=marine sediment metagenome TaxID=412755 RepID=A0A0F9HV94_9ZZZZ